MTGWTRPESPFHAGEQAVQTRLGSRARAERGGRHMIQGALTDDFRELFAELPMLIAGSLDAEGRPWASPLFGHPGFAQSPRPEVLAIAARPGRGDPLAAALAAAAPIGLLGLQPETRSRVRANGHVAAASPEGFVVRVEQAFFNCPKYIHPRPLAIHNDPAATAAAWALRAESARLSPEATALLARTDTLFLASAGARAALGDVVSGVDVSHRGGPAGFVTAAERGGATELSIPDYVGNALYNTLGNLHENPRAGLLVIDFESGAILSLTTHAEIVWEPERALRLRVESGFLVERAAPTAIFTA